MSEKILSISEITGEIKYLLEDNFDDIKIKGEISNFKQHSSGHRYFSLKDDNASISAVMWKSSRLNFEPEDGMDVVATGSISVYPARGNYQIVVRSMQPEGQGDLHKAFEALKKKLLEKGYFDEIRKRTIPTIPRKIGIATSPTGAAKRDLFSTIERRFPALEIYFRPTLVQGDGAAESIVAAIKELNEYDLDAIIIGRGGGSLEDLWCFNEEIVADAVFNSKIPIISAVGHEPDVSISDYVADIRAATPTAAGELVTPFTLIDLIEMLKDKKLQSTRTLLRKIESIRESSKGLVAERIPKALINKVNLYRQKIDDFRTYSTKDLNNFLNETKNKFNLLKAEIANNSPINVLKDKKNILDKHLSLVHSLNPKRPLDKNFAYLQHKGKTIGNDVSLYDFSNIDIIRKNETVKVKIDKTNQESLF